ncbi:MULTISPECIES: hypothetical protein [Novosphingobium]|uniref:hypothetical protein n=1 Tax=Novosphingobium TaxID=165696 RepID=UPI001CD37A2F|nr:hypothetical protein [Novosphingobium percolationis]
MTKYSASFLGLAAAFALSGTAYAAEGEDVAIDTPIEVVDPVVETAVDPVDVKLDDPVEITRAGDDGIIGETERNLGGGDPLENPDVIFYTMGAGGAGFDPVEQAAETAAEQAAQQVADRMADKAAASEAPLPAEPR